MALKIYIKVTVIVRDTPSHADDHICPIWKDSIQNYRCYRADTAHGTDRQMDRWTDRQMDRQMDERVAGRIVHRPAGRPAGRPRQTDRQTDGLTNRVKPIYPPTTCIIRLYGIFTRSDVNTHVETPVFCQYLIYCNYLFCG